MAEKMRRGQVPEVKIAPLKPVERTMNISVSLVPSRVAWLKKRAAREGASVSAVIGALVDAGEAIDQLDQPA